MAQSKKKYRISLTCTLCRRRKIRCDKTMPSCSACRRNNTSYLCHYPENGDERGVAKKGAPADELARLKEKIALLESKMAALSPVSEQKSPSSHSETSSGTSECSRSTLLEPLVGRNPYRRETDGFNFFEGYSSVFMKGVRSINHGPMSWITLMKKDLVLSYLWKRMGQQRKKGCPFPIGETANQKRSTKPRIAYDSKSDRQFQELMIENEGIVDMQPYKDEETDKTPVLTSKSSEENPHRSKETQPDYEALFLAKVQKLMPKRRVIWLLVDRFFFYVYPFMPILDETEFRRDIAPFVGRYDLSETVIDEMVLTRKTDLALLGTLLLVLRLGYISLIPNIPSEAAVCDTDRYLLSNPISFEFAKAAQICINHFKLLRRSSLPLLQCALCMRMYRVYAPEDGDGPDGGESQIFTGLLIQMATSIGLNRDPDNFSDVPENESLSNLSRKIWSHLVLLDVLQGALLGNPLAIHEQSYDTALPYSLPGINENSRDPALESRIVDHFLVVERVTTKFKSLLSSVLAVKNRTSMLTLSGELTEIETYFHDNFGLLHELLTPHSQDMDRYATLKKVYDIRLYIWGKLFLLAVYYYIFLYYEAERNTELAFYYMRKMLVVFSVELVPGFMKLWMNSEQYVGPGYSLIFNPIIEIGCHKSTQFMFAMASRCKLCLLRVPSDEREKREMVEKIFNMAVVGVEKGNKLIGKLSTRYYYAWRMTKAQARVVHLLRNTFFRKDTDMESTGTSLDEIDYEVIHKINLFNCFGKNEFREILDILEVSWQETWGEPSDGANNSHAKTPIASELPELASSAKLADIDDYSYGQNRPDRDIDDYWLKAVSNNKMSAGDLYDQGFPNYAQKSPNSPVMNNIGGDYLGSSWGTSFEDAELQDFLKDSAVSVDIFGDFSFEEVFNGN